MFLAFHQIYQKIVEIFFHFSNTRWEYSLVLKRIQRKQTFRLTHRRWGTFREEERLRLSDRNSILMT